MPCFFSSNRYSEPFWRWLALFLALAGLAALVVPTQRQFPEVSQRAACLVA